MSASRVSPAARGRPSLGSTQRRYPSIALGSTSETNTLYVRKGYEGRLIGRGGENIRRIESRTGRRWKVVGE
ncbi:KH domain-containing protein [Candidatus Uhrbacteria bacterium]|nr:KH domain-containing protein [Candidatus Uhrbacteria bacterium]